ncbi:leucine-rich repeat extensin-like protein 5 isoform X1 [Meleagris gallopavo]|uniref:leucine-rich repeat extensin-like protein 5 isoform X1 n=1 Tax=Meleagris gallopavo TaxID=9103 RepID=UPI000939A990|nr:leucine-rich repeat extensin-like protein 5 isoform X1 [Meleagris gallopavo]
MGPTLPCPQGVRVSSVSLSPRCPSLGPNTALFPRCPCVPVPRTSIHVPNVSPSQDVRPCVPHAPVPKVSVCPTQLCPQGVHPCALRVPCHPVPRMPSTCPRVRPQDVLLWVPHSFVPKVSVCPCPQDVHPCVPRVPVPMMPMCPMSSCPKVSVCPACPCPQDVHPCVPHVPVPKMSIRVSHMSLSPRCPSMCPACPCPHDAHVSHVILSQGVRVSHVVLSPRCPCFPHSFVPKVSVCPLCPCPQGVPLWVPILPCPQGVCVSLSPGRPSMSPMCPHPRDVRPCVPHAPVPRVSVCPTQLCPQGVHPCALRVPCHPVPRMPSMCPCVPVPKMSFYGSHTTLSPRCLCVPVPKMPIGVHTALSPGCHPVSPVSLSPRCPFMGPMCFCPQHVRVSGCPSVCPTQLCPQAVHPSTHMVAPRCPRPGNQTQNPPKPPQTHHL